MRMVLIDESVAEGFDSNWELNEYGAKVERLIERLGDLYIFNKKNKIRPLKKLIKSCLTSLYSLRRKYPPQTTNDKGQQSGNR